MFPSFSQLSISQLSQLNYEVGAEEGLLRSGFAPVSGNKARKSPHEPTPPPLYKVSNEIPQPLKVSEQEKKADLELMQSVADALEQRTLAAAAYVLYTLLKTSQEGLADTECLTIEEAASIADELFSFQKYDPNWTKNCLGNFAAVGETLSELAEQYALDKYSVDALGRTKRAVSGQGENVDFKKLRVMPRQECNPIPTPVVVPGAVGAHLSTQDLNERVKNLNAVIEKHARRNETKSLLLALWCSSLRLVCGHRQEYKETLPVLTFEGPRQRRLSTLMEELSTGTNASLSTHLVTRAKNTLKLLDSALGKNEWFTVQLTEPVNNLRNGAVLRNLSFYMDQACSPLDACAKRMLARLVQKERAPGLTLLQATEQIDTEFTLLSFGREPETLATNTKNAIIHLASVEVAATVCAVDDEDVGVKRRYSHILHSAALELLVDRSGMNPAALKEREVVRFLSQCYPDVTSEEELKDRENAKKWVEVEKVEEPSTYRCLDAAQITRSVIKNMGDYKEQPKRGCRRYSLPIRIALAGAWRFLCAVYYTINGTGARATIQVKGSERPPAAAGQPQRDVPVEVLLGEYISLEVQHDTSQAQARCDTLVLALKTFLTTVPGAPGPGRGGSAPKKWARATEFDIKQIEDTMDAFIKHVMDELCTMSSSGWTYGSPGQAETLLPLKDSLFVFSMVERIISSCFTASVDFGVLGDALDPIEVFKRRCAYHSENDHSNAIKAGIGFAPNDAFRMNYFAEKASLGSSYKTFGKGLCTVSTAAACALTGSWQAGVGLAIATPVFIDMFFLALQRRLEQNREKAQGLLPRLKQALLHGGAFKRIEWPGVIAGAGAFETPRFAAVAHRYYWNSYAAAAAELTTRGPTLSVAHSAALPPASGFFDSYLINPSLAMAGWAIENMQRTEQNRIEEARQRNQRNTEDGSDEPMTPLPTRTICQRMLTYLNGMQSRERINFSSPMVCHNANLLLVNEGACNEKYDGRLICPKTLVMAAEPADWAAAGTLAILEKTQQDLLVPAMNGIQQACIHTAEYVVSNPTAATTCAPVGVVREWISVDPYTYVGPASVVHNWRKHICIALGTIVAGVATPFRKIAIHANCLLQLTMMLWEREFATNSSHDRWFNAARLSNYCLRNLDAINQRLQTSWSVNELVDSRTSMDLKPNNASIEYVLNAARIKIENEYGEATGPPVEVEQAGNTRLLTRLSKKLFSFFWRE